jgi:hypothetical protein
VSQRAVDIPVNTLVYDSYFVLYYALERDTRDWMFIGISLLLLILVSCPAALRRWLFAAELLLLSALSAWFLRSSYQIAKNAGLAFAKSLAEKPPYSLCVAVKSELATSIRPVFLDGPSPNQRCGLHTIAETPELLFVFDRANEKGLPAHVFTLRRDDLVLVDVSPIPTTSPASASSPTPTAAVSTSSPQPSSVETPPQPPIPSR